MGVLGEIMDDKLWVIAAITILGTVAFFKPDSIEIFTHACAVLGGFAVGKPK